MRDETMALLVEQGLEKYKDDIATSLPYGIQRRLEIAARWRRIRSCCCLMSRRLA